MPSPVRAGTAVLAVLLLFGVLWASPPSVHAATYVVDSTADTGDAAPGTGGCDDGTGACTLRAAIEEANANPILISGKHTVNFNIPGAGPHTIQPASPLPTITEGLLIDGYSEAGASPNTNAHPAGTNAVLMIELDGSNAGAAADGLVLATESLVRGLVINRFDGNGIRTQSGSLLPLRDIAGNFIGTDTSGTVALPNGGSGILSEYLATVGLVLDPGRPYSGAALANRNVISGNAGAGILGANVVAEGNLIGVAADGTSPLGNGGGGIELDTGGGTDKVGPPGNVIAYNGGAGIGPSTAGQLPEVEIRQNSIHSNGGLGIEVAGPNPPQLMAVQFHSSTLTIDGTYGGDPDEDYTLEFFSNPECDPSGAGEGKTFLGSAIITTDGLGNASFSVTFAKPAASEAIFTATATDGSLRTSEFSQCLSPPEDADADGVHSEDELNCGGDPFDPNIRPERIDGPFAGVDDDGDTIMDEALPGGSGGYDCDGDGYTGTAEDHVYSYDGQTNGDQKTCQEYDLTHPNPQENTKPSLRWPSDLNMQSNSPNSFNRLNILDLASFVAPIRYLGKDVGSFPDDVRWDLSPGPGPLVPDINILDLAAMTAPGAASGAPPMFLGARAFLGPECPWPE